MPTEASVAQSVERLTRNEQVTGSIPVAGSMFFGGLIRFDSDLVSEISRVVASFFCRFFVETRFVIAVSGGVDSMALFHLMINALPDRRERFCVAHLNHGIREASASEYDGVRQLCEREGIRFFGDKVDIPLLAREAYRGRSLEEVARIERRLFLERAREEWDAAYIVTAHHRNDLLETFLMRLTRGSGLSGFDCMKAIEAPFLRPLLPFWKADIVRYAEDQKVFYYEDQTNQDNRFLRNRIRNELVPFLSTRFGASVRDVLVRDQEQLSLASQVMEELLEPFVRSAVHPEEEPRFSWEALKEHSDAFLSELFVRSYKRWRGHTQGIESVKMARTMKRLRQPGSFAIPFRERVWFFREFDRCGFTSEKAERVEYRKRSGLNPAVGVWENPDDPFCFRAHFGTCLTLTAQRGLRPEDMKIPTEDRWTALFDEDKIKFPLLIRAAKPGDRFRPLGMSGQKKITRFCADQKMPIKNRREMLLLINQKSDIIWCIGIRIADTVKITCETRRVMRVRCQLEPEKGMEGRERSIPQFFD